MFECVLLKTWEANTFLHVNTSKDKTRKENIIGNLPLKVKPTWVSVSYCTCKYHFVNCMYNYIFICSGLWNYEKKKKKKKADIAYDKGTGC